MKRIKNKKTIFTLGATVLLFLSLVLYLKFIKTAWPATVTYKKQKDVSFSFIAEKKPFIVGQTSKISFFIEPNKGKEIIIASAVLNYNKDALKIIRIKGNKQFSKHLQLEYNNQIGEITIKQAVAGGQPPVAKKTKFAEIEFIPLKEINNAKITLNQNKTTIVSDEAKYMTLIAKNLKFSIKK